jgi:RNA polymerase sigma-70 factor (ECF subfamily)
MFDRVTLDNALARLSPGYRKVFVLHDVQGYGHVEIARLLEITEGTSKSQLHKARHRLRLLLHKVRSARRYSGVASPLHPTVKQRKSLSRNIQFRAA